MIKKLLTQIEKNLKSAGFDDKASDSKLELSDINHKDSNLLLVIVCCRENQGVLDKIISAVNVTYTVNNTEFYAHAVSNKKTKRISGKELYEHKAMFMFKYKLINEED